MKDLVIKFIKEYIEKGKIDSNSYYDKDSFITYNIRADIKNETG